MFAQRFANRLLDYLRRIDDDDKVSLISESGDPKTKSDQSISAEDQSVTTEDEDSEEEEWNEAETEVESVESVEHLEGDDSTDQLFTDKIILQACSDCCLTPSDILHKFPRNMILRYDDGVVIAIFENSEQETTEIQIYPKKSEESEDEAEESTFEETDEDESCFTAISDLESLADGNECEGEGEEDEETSLNTESDEGSVFEELNKHEQHELELFDYYPYPTDIEDDDYCSRMSNFVPYRLHPKKIKDVEKADVYYIDLQIHKVPRYDKIKKKTLWVDEFFIDHKDPKFTAQTFSGTRFGSVKLKNHALQFTDRGAGFYHFTMPSIVPTLRLMANGASAWSLTKNETESEEQAQESENSGEEEAEACSA
ncbi:unnamed protein product [Bursaphelenchus okinawaensis]|uniref:Uncharacterized protein n=1 Tax=Bursaphelenchus okinawaensis TaxID=465554 RepID=A0A811JQH4_9BILA|nr:unnamed protein product [Bursaphelenchus okinawaensis]CAG9078231.1 unnamed protein product [Bursaphelenchus okinawaensis]